MNTFADHALAAIGILLVLFMLTVMIGAAFTSLSTASHKVTEVPKDEGDEAEERLLSRGASERNE